ncbi:MAG: TonB-dependent receptor, partial [Cytophagales bacterium]|nr:TonB-dependent receptor [Cytophagales bacterium]
ESAGLLRVYNSTGNSFATSVQAELSLVPSNRWELKAAYRWLNVKHYMRTSEGENVVRQRVFVPRDLVLLNGTYSLPYDKWKVDLTLQYKGKQRIPFETTDRYADGFVTVNTQISRNFVNWEYYLGAENLTNFRQPNPIITPDNPFGDVFDAGQTWGPVVGRIIYAGARFKIR